MVSVLFSHTIRTKARQTSTMTSIILASPHDDRETMQAPSAYSIPHTAQRTQYIIARSGPIDVGGSFRCTSSASMAVYGCSEDLDAFRFFYKIRAYTNNSEIIY